MADKTLVCIYCDKEFTFTEGEQEFYKEKGFEDEPKRCSDCKKNTKEQRIVKNYYYERRKSKKT